jgi:hypothetical protein
LPEETKTSKQARELPVEEESEEEEELKESDLLKSS